MNGVRYEQGTPVYRANPRARASSTKVSAAITRCSRRGRDSRPGELAGAVEVVQVVDAAPVAVDVQDLDCPTVVDERVEEVRHVEPVEVRPLREALHHAVQPADTLAPHGEHPDPPAVRPGGLARHTAQQHLA